MLKFLLLEGVGPASRFGPVEFAPRLNFITGDNGLGKSFLLDICWWVLTRTWARNSSAIPQPKVRNPRIHYAFSKTKAIEVSDISSFRRESQSWTPRPSRPSTPGVVLYAGVDGCFSAWDPTRNHWNDKDSSPDPERPRAFHFTADEVWSGLKGPSGVQYCNGLIQDWVLWQKGGDPAFGDLTKVLDALSPSGLEKLTPGKPVRIGLDVKDYPSLHLPYGQDVALTHASAGMRRIAALAYLLVWTWREHLLACEQTGAKPAREIIFLVDEIECHLHPQWQRRIVPALLGVMKALTARSIPVQLILSTHSPLVLASAEPAFDERLDATFNISLQHGEAVIVRESWAKQGDIVNWLVSDAFGLRQARSVEAEEAIEAAEAWMRQERDGLPGHLRTRDAIHQALQRALPGSDHFWPRWIVWTEARANKRESIA